MKYLFTVFVLLLVVSIVAAQEACPIIVETALENASALCLETARNQACYGNVLVDAEGHSEELTFDEPGNIVDVNDLAALELSPMDEENSEWGIALLRLQANLPDTLPGQNVTVLAFGDVELTDASEEDDNPMQAFYFQSGIGEAACAEAPSGVLVQTPEGAVEVALNVNGVDIQLGSTAFLQAVSAEELEADQGLFKISMLEGQATVTADDETVVVEVGMETLIPLDEDLQADGAPSEPEPIDPADFPPLPLTLLEREVEFEAEASGTPEASSSAAITPRSGTWLYSVGDTTVSGGCPPGMEDAMNSAEQTSYTTEMTWGEGYSIDSMMAVSEMGALPEGMEMTQPEPNLIRMTMGVEGAETLVDYRLVSETLIEITVQTTVTGGCTITIPATMEYQG